MPSKRAEPTLVRFGRRVCELRESKDWSQELLAERLELKQEYVSRIERGDENLTILSLAKLASALECDIGDLFVAPTDIAPRRAGRPRKKAR